MNALVMADFGDTAEVRAEVGAAAREVASEEDAAAIRVEAEAEAAEDADTGHDLALRAIEEAKVEAEVVREGEEPAGNRPRRSNGPTTRLTTEARVQCVKWIRSTDRNRKRGSPELAASTCQRRRPSRKISNNSPCCVRTPTPKASKSKRKKLLEWFRDRFVPSDHTTSSGGGGELLESECGPDVSLFLARILVWMAKTIALSGNQKCFALMEQLECVRIFLTSTANAHVYYREFQQVDGLALLIKVLNLEDNSGVVSDANRQLVNELILRISRRGRAHKEEISRCGGEIAIIRGALAGRERCKDMESSLWDSCRDVLLGQMVGNPKSVEQVHEAVILMLQRQDEKALQVFGAQILRYLITPDSFYLDLTYRKAKEHELIPLALGILQSSDIPLQHEGLELVHSLLQNTHLQNSVTQREICRALMEWVKHAAIMSEPLDERFALVQFSREHETFVHMRSQFVHAAQSVSTLINSTPEILPLMVKQLEILVSLSFALVVERAQSLKWYAAAIATHYIFTSYREATAAHLSQIFSIPVKKILTWKAHHLQPEDLAMALLQSDEQQQLLALQFFQNGWKKPVSTHHHQQLKRHDKSEEEGDQNGDLDIFDSELSQLELEVEAALRDFVPELQVPTHYDPESGERDLYCDAMDQLCEHRMRVTLQRHFSQFRSVISSSSDAPTLLSPPS